MKRRGSLLKAKILAFTDLGLFDDMHDAAKQHVWIEHALGRLAKARLAVRNGLASGKITEQDAEAIMNEVVLPSLKIIEQRTTNTLGIVSQMQEKVDGYLKKL